MPVTYYGPLCARRGCSRPEWEDGLCHACRRLARMFGKDPRLFAHLPLHAYHDEKDTTELPWSDLEAAARERGVGLADLIGGVDDAESPRSAA